MTLLLDTHALLWWLDDPRLLSKAARKAITEIVLGMAARNEIELIPPVDEAA